MKLVGDIQDLAKLNTIKDKKTKEVKPVSVDDPENGCYIQLKYDSKADGPNKWSVNKGDRAPLSEKQIKAISKLKPFEGYIAEIYKAKGFEVATDQIIQGKCVSHEVDVVAWNENKLIMAEAKFHNELGIKSDLKVALYVKARYDDIHGIEYNYGKRRKLDEGLLITNTNFTVKAVEYSECAGVKLIGWNYPSQGNLHDMIEDMGLHPVTCLTTLTNSEKKDLMENGITLCRNVRDSADKLMQLGLSREAIDQAVEESNFMCPPNA
jgi:hypothetical protein